MSGALASGSASGEWLFSVRPGRARSARCGPGEARPSGRVCNFGKKLAEDFVTRFRAPGDCES